jgi:N utilization substance protein B
MGSRRKAREVSLQLLYEIELSQRDYLQVVQEFLSNPALRLQNLGESLSEVEEVKKFTQLITEGVAANVREIDALIESHSTHWKISRMASVDKNILRMGVFELLYCPDIPSSVTINEAIEIAKKFGNEDSSSFINGVLDHIAKELKK